MRGYKLIVFLLTEQSFDVLVSDLVQNGYKIASARENNAPPLSTSDYIGHTVALTLYTNDDTKKCKSMLSKLFDKFSIFGAYLVTPGDGNIIFHSNIKRDPEQGPYRSKPSD